MDRNDIAKERARRMVATISPRGLVRIPDHAAVQYVEGGAFIDAVVWLADPYEQPKDDPEERL